MPAKLILSLNNSVLGEFPLDKERIIVGRKPENDIQVDNLAVSGQHAAIITILNDSFLEDLDSTNGTFVNGKLVKKHALKHGDVITIGKHELKYVNDEATTDDQDFLRVDGDAFGACPSESIDYAVMENTDRAVVVPLDVGWDDVGAWSAL